MLSVWCPCKISRGFVKWPPLHSGAIHSVHALDGVLVMLDVVRSVAHYRLLAIIDILSKSTITLTFTVLTPSRDKRRYRITEKRYRAQNNGPTFVMEILQKMQKLALFCNWREIKSTSCRSRWDRESRLLPLVTFSFFWRVLPFSWQFLRPLLRAFPLYPIWETKDQFHGTPEEEIHRPLPDVLELENPYSLRCCV